MLTPPKKQGRIKHLFFCFVYVNADFEHFAMSVDFSHI